MVHPLPPRPGSYQPPTSSNRPPPTHSTIPAPPIPTATTPLSLPNRPTAPPLSSLSSSTSSTLPSRPPLNSSTSSFFGLVASPKLSASSASSATGREFTGGSGATGGVGESLPWPRVRGKLTPEEAKVDSELIEIGQGWSVKYKCWKGASIPLSTLSDSGSSNYDPFLPTTSNFAPLSATSSSSTIQTTNPSPEKGKGKEPEGPPKKKARPTLNPSDSLFGDELATTLNSPLAGLTSVPPTPLPKFNQPTTRTDASTSKLEDQLKTIRSSTICNEEDPFERARRDLIRRGKQKVEEGGDRFDLMCFVRVARTQIESNRKESEEDVKGKGKEKEKATKVEEAKTEAAGRTLWAFSVIRGGDLETSKNVLDDLDLDGLECVASGTFDHQALYPALYPPSSTSTSNSNFAGSSPLSRAAQSYPSALALSANFLSSSNPRKHPLVIAHQAFTSAIEETLLSEMVSVPPLQRTPQQIGQSLVLLHPYTSTYDFDLFDSNALPASPRKRSQPLSTLSTFHTTLQRSTIFVQTRIKEVPYRPLPPPTATVPLVGYPVLLAPLGLKARIFRRIHLDRSQLSEGNAVKLRNRWRNQLEGSNLEVEGNDWIICRLEIGQHDAHEDEGMYIEGDSELVWPSELVVIDGTRPPPPPSPRSSPDKPPSTQLSPEEPPQQQGHLPATSPDAKFPPPPSTTPEMSNPLPRPTSQSRFRATPLLPSPYDSSIRRRLAAQAFGGSKRRSKTEDLDEETKLPRDPLSKRTNEVWSWMEDETARRVREAEERVLKEQREKEEQEEERKRSEEMEREKKKSKNAPPQAAAPINMRTPMSLGTSSTEAPSPADLVYPYSTSATTSGSQQNYLTTPTSTSAPSCRTGGDAMEIDGLGLGLYPSPEEPPHLHPHSQSTQQPASTSQPMSSLDNAFASFDWGDGSYGTTGGGDRVDGDDDGMDLLGLTDDDFSFFDTAPTPLPGSSVPPPNDMSLSIAHDPFAMPHSTTTSPKFIDHFSHLSAAPFASSHSPTSPYPAHTSPHFATQSSPVATATSHFSFDANANSLGLAAAPSSSVEAPQEALPSPQEEPVKLVVPSFSVELVKRPSPPNQLLPSPHRSRLPLPGAFEAIAFAPSYLQSSEKYDSRKGKFGLPTPESDNEDDLAFERRHLSLETVLPRPTPASLEPWYSGICDPRRAVAERLQRNRMSKEKRGRSTSRGRGTRGLMKNRGWKRAISRSEEGSDGTVTADEESEFGSDMEVEEVERESSRNNLDDQQEAVKESHNLLETGGVELLGLGGEFVTSLVQRQPLAKSTSTPVSFAALQAREQLLILLVDQRLVNPASQQMFPIVQNEGKLLSTFAIKDISFALASVCSTLSPSPLFADHTLLPPLEVTASPSLLIRSQQSMIQVSTSAVEFWKPMGFEPVIGRKDVTVFAIYEEAGSGMHDTVGDWLKMMATTYQGLRLGEQNPGQLPASGQFGGIQDGHLALPAGCLARGMSKEDSKVLSTALIDISKQYHNVAIFVFGPSNSTEPFSATSPLFSLLHLLQRYKPTLSSMVTCPIPLSHLYKSEPSQGRASTNLLANYAFSLYDQLQVPVARLRLPVPETFPSAAAAPNPANQGPSIRLFQSPAIKLAPVRPRKISFDMNFPVSTLAVQQRHRFLHVCYTSTPATTDGSADWIHLASIDDTGETWRTVNRLMKTVPGGPGDVYRARVVWQLILTLLQSIDVEWRIVICRLGEPSVLEIRAWDSMLKDQLHGSIRRPLHASFVYLDLDPPLAILPAEEPKARRTSIQSDTISEEGELSLVSRSNPSSNSKTEPLFDTEPTILSFTPSEPVNVIPSVTLFAPASSYLIHVPRIPTFTHSTFDSSSSPPPSSSPSPISIYGIHFLLSHASRTSSYSAPLSDFVKDVRQSYSELAALAKIRWNMNGRLPWHFEAVKTAKEISDSFSQRTSD